CTGPLAPGATTSCTSKHTITQAHLDNGSITNTATASGNGTTSPPATAKVTATQRPTLTLTKTASPTTYSAVGDVITYTYTVKNRAEERRVGKYSVSDDKQETFSYDTGPLAPGDTTSCTSTHTITTVDLYKRRITQKASE